MAKIVIVTGGAGYIGSHTVVELINTGYVPVIIDDFRNSKLWIIDRIEKLTGVRPDHYAIDCLDETAFTKALLNYTEISGFIHFAADKAVGESVKNPIKYYENNIGSLCVALKVMEKFKVNNLVFSSSCTVYGESETPIVTEDTVVREASSPYGDTKITSEKIIRFNSAAKLDFNAFLLRYFNPIGAHPSALIGELPQGVPNNLVPFLTQTAKGIRSELTIFGNDYPTPDGTNIRDYIHVVDLAKAHVAALDYLNNVEDKFCDVLNLGTGKGTSVLELIQAFEKVNELTLNYKFGARRSGDVAQIYANADKAKRLLNWTCDYTIDDALKHAWEWQKQIPAEV